uniref:BTB domain-containing protein n=1 Tax=Panagrellus redivivus TaxID=6233 RepID=A0A7E4ZX03_PANRE
MLKYKTKVLNSVPSSACINVPYDQERKTCEEYIKYTDSNIPSVYGLQVHSWSFKCVVGNCISLYIKAHTSQNSINAKTYITVEGTMIEKNIEVMLDDIKYSHVGCIYQNTEMPQEDIKICCHVIFQHVEPVRKPVEKAPFALNFKKVLGVCQDKNSDAEIHVDDNCIKIHRHYFAMISPVFNAMFNNDTKEKQTGIVEIKDMDYLTVVDSVNLCYGQPLEDKTTQEIINILIFGDKYFIKAIMSKAEEWLLDNLHPFNFCTILSYAWEGSNEKLKTACARYYRRHVDPIALTQEFGELDKEVLAGLIKNANAIS